MSAETYVGTAEDGIHLAAITITRIGGQILTLGYEDDAGSVDSVQPLATDIEGGIIDYISWITEELDYKRSETPWNVYAVEIACDRGQWTYLASHNPAVPLEDWAREQRALCMATPDQPWTVSVHQPDADGNPAGAPVVKVEGGR